MVKLEIDNPFIHGIAEELDSYVTPSRELTKDIIKREYLTKLEDLFKDKKISLRQLKIWKTPENSLNLIYLRKYRYNNFI